jgi:hypothetical protein
MQSLKQWEFRNKIGKNYVRVIPMRIGVLNYARYLGTNTRIKCDSTVAS